jgi:hypothetical protein
MEVALRHAGGIACSKGEERGARDRQRILVGQAVRKVLSGGGG